MKYRLKCGKKNTKINEISVKCLKIFINEYIFLKFVSEFIDIRYIDNIFEYFKPWAQDLTQTLT